MSMPSITPSGRADTKLPAAMASARLRWVAVVMPMDRAASMSQRSMPQACLAWVSVVSSVMRRPLWYCGVWPRASARALIWLREPCTTTSRTPRLASRLRSAASVRKVAPSSRLPAMPITSVLPRR